MVRRRIHSKGKQIQIPLHGIPICSGNKVAPEDSLAEEYPELLKEWDFLDNYVLCDPHKISKASPTVVWWNCQNDLNHKYPMAVRDRVAFLVRSKKPCPFCKELRRKKNHFI